MRRHTGHMNGERFSGIRILYFAVVFMWIGCSPESVPRSPATGGVAAQTEGKRTAQEVFKEGTGLGKSGNYQAALQAYSRAIQLDPVYRDAYTSRALTYVELGNARAAIKDLDTIVALDPSADSYRLRADVSARSGHIDNAIADYGKSLEINPHDASVYRNRATAYGEKRDLARAITDITKAIDLEPDNPRWRFDRAMFRARKGDYGEAMDDAEDALRLAGGTPRLSPGEAKVTDELTFNCLRLIADLERAGAKRAR